MSRTCIILLVCKPLCDVFVFRPDRSKLHFWIILRRAIGHLRTRKHPPVALLVTFITWKQTVRSFVRDSARGTSNSLESSTACNNEKPHGSEPAEPWAIDIPRKVEGTKTLRGPARCAGSEPPWHERDRRVHANILHHWPRFLWTNCLLLSRISAPLSLDFCTPTEVIFFFPWIFFRSRPCADAGIRKRAPRVGAVHVRVRRLEKDLALMVGIGSRFADVWTRLY